MCADDGMKRLNACKRQNERKEIRNHKKRPSRAIVASECAVNRSARNREATVESECVKTENETVNSECSVRLTSHQAHTPTRHPPSNRHNSNSRNRRILLACFCTCRCSRRRRSSRIADGWDRLLCCLPWGSVSVELEERGRGRILEGGDVPDVVVVVAEVPRVCVAAHDGMGFWERVGCCRGGVVGV